MEIVPTPESPVTFEQFMAGMQELRKFQEETARQMRETDKKISKLGSVNGSLKGADFGCN